MIGVAPSHPRLTPSRSALFLWFLALCLFPVDRGVAQQPDSASVARFQLAESFLRSGQFDRAINILEQLYEARPSTFVFFNRLKQAYESTKRYEDAIRLVDDQIEREPLPVTHFADRGRLRYLQGEEEGAMQDFREAIDLAPERSSSYVAVYQILVQLRLFEQAASLMEDGRARLGDASLFRRELGYLYGLLGAHGRAMEEYVGLLGEDERQLGV
ncbi:MAG: tetratricopeptide repeat protein, partial [Rhodothermales bacterium]|nr:tetratricopeptide repeat protein [Rhodothermales bacterium]